MLFLGRPMSNYPHHRDLMKILKVLNFDSVHWSIDSGWEIAHSLAAIVLLETKRLLGVA
jgi:hypothetical protein